MEAGCQQIFKHRVKKEPNVTDERFCLSFRRRVEKASPDIPPKDLNIGPSHKVPEALVPDLEGLRSSQWSDPYGSGPPGHCPLTPPPPAKGIPLPPLPLKEKYPQLKSIKRMD